MNNTVLEVKDLRCKFLIKNNFFKSNIYLEAINDVTFDIQKGETLGIVGESGCGKSTLCRTITNLNNKSSGDIKWFNKDLDDYNAKELKSLRKRIQIIFQDPYGSLDPRMNIGNIIKEPVEIFNKDLSSVDKAFKVISVMDKVGLSKDLYNRYPHELSGGQCQRVGIARAIINEPEVLICDEPVSSLDLSVQSQILDLLDELKLNYNLTMVFVSHDLSVIKNISDNVIVMHEGKIIEKNNSKDLFSSPKEEYTKKLINSVPSPIPVEKKHGS